MRATDLPSVLDVDNGQCGNFGSHWGSGTKNRDQRNIPSEMVRTAFLVPARPP